MATKTVNIKGVYSINSRYGYDKKYHLDFKSMRLKKSDDSVHFKLELDEYEMVEMLKQLLSMVDTKTEHFKNEMKIIRKAMRYTNTQAIIKYMAE